MKRLAWYVAVILATLTLAILFWEFRGALVLFLISLAVNAAVMPVVDRLAERGLPQAIALFLTYTLGLALLAMVIISISGSLLNELQRAADDLALAYEQIKETWPQGSRFQQSIAERLPPAGKLFEAITGRQGAMLAQALLGVTTGLFGMLADTAIIIVLSIYWGLGQDRFERLWLSLLPAEHRTRARDIWRAIEKGVGAYIRSELAQSLLAGVMLGLGFRLMGMPYATLLAVVGALAWLFPWVGVVLAVIPVLLVGLLVGPLLGGAAVLYTIVIFLLLEALVEPRLFNRRRYSSILVVLTMIALADAFGIIGILIAPPLAAAIQIFFGRLLRQSAEQPPVAHARQIANLRRRLASVRQSIERTGSPPEPEVQSVIERLSRLIEESSQNPKAADTQISVSAPAAETSLQRGGAERDRPIGRQ